METAAIALGSNLGDRLETMRTAASRIATLGSGLQKSPVYETVPIGPPQPDFLNAVVLLQTNLGPEALLRELLAIEQQLGRVRRQRWGPRVIDLDLLVYGDRELQTPELTLPHPELPHRAFVLSPWADIAPELEVPRLGTVRSLLRRLSAAERDSVRIQTRNL